MRHNKKHNKMNQVVLDIDLDYVMGEQCYTNTAMGRKSPDMNVSISVSKFVKFLNVIGLRHASDGLGFESHTISAKIWEKLILQGSLRPPFTVIHVDAHHDIYSTHSNMSRPLLNCGNYLVPFLEAGLIDKLVWIAPKECASWKDRAWYKHNRLKLISGGRRDLKSELAHVLQGREYAFTTIAFSPNYCGVTADAVLPILMQRLSPSAKTIEIMIALSKSYKHEFNRSRFYIEESPYFKEDSDGVQARIYVPRLVSRIRQ